LVERNFTLRLGEIDLILHEPQRNVLVFVEVRYRKNRAYGGPLASINSQKQRRLRRTANAYLQMHSRNIGGARIDVVGIQPAKPSAANALPEELRTAMGSPVLFDGYEIVWIPNAVSG